MWRPPEPTSVSTETDAVVRRFPAALPGTGPLRREGDTGCALRHLRRRPPRLLPTTTVTGLCAPAVTDGGARRSRTRRPRAAGGPAGEHGGGLGAVRRGEGGDARVVVGS